MLIRRFFKFLSFRQSSSQILLNCRVLRLKLSLIITLIEIGVYGKGVFVIWKDHFVFQWVNEDVALLDYHFFVINILTKAILSPVRLKHNRKRSFGESCIGNILTVTDHLWIDWFVWPDLRLSLLLLWLWLRPFTSSIASYFLSEKSRISRMIYFIIE